MVDKTKQIFLGCIGFFTPLDTEGKEIEDDPQRGYIKLDDDGVLEVETLDENPLDTMELYTGRTGSPPAIIGITKDNSILLLDTSNGGGSTNIGGFRASVRKYYAKSAIFNVSPNEVNNTKVKEASIFFPNLGPWSGIEGSKETSDTDQSGRLQGYTIELRNTPELEAPLSEGKSITVSAHWSIDGPRDRREIYSPIKIGCKSESPVELLEIIYPLTKIQELISLAYDGFIKGDGGLATIEGDREATSKQLWNYWLMIAPKAAKVPKDMTEPPFFQLANLGGIEALPRWIELCESHARSVKPVVDRYRLGDTSPELALLEIAAGLEHWKSSHAKDPAATWTNESYPSMAVAVHAGVAFSNWIDAPEKWADKFWSTYNKLKHDPKFQPNVHEVKMLAAVGQRLLASELLAEIAPGTSIQERYLSSHRIHNYGAMIKEYLKSTAP